MTTNGTTATVSTDLREVAKQLRDRISIRQVLEERGVTFRPAGRSLVALCPFHPEDRPSFQVSASTHDGVERFHCYGCGAGRARTNHDSAHGSWGDVFDLVQLLENYPDYLSTLRALAERYGVAWPLRTATDTSTITRTLDAATQYYAKQLSGLPLAYLAARGLPEAFLKQHRVGFAPREPGFGFTRFAEAQNFDQVAESLGLIQKPTDTRPRRDYFLSRIIFPNVDHGHTTDLQGRAFPADREPKYLNLRGARRRLYHAQACGHTHVLLCEGIPDTLSAVLAGHAACGVYGTEGWTREHQPLFRRCRRVYVAFDRDATDRAIAVAKDFGFRGRVLIPPEELGPKGDLNGWLVGPAKGDPTQLRGLLSAAMAESPSPWALAIDRLPNVPPWERPEQIAELLEEIAPMPAVYRELYLDLLSTKVGLSLATLTQAADTLEREAGSSTT